MNALIKFISAGLAASLLTACGGGGSNSTPNPGPENSSISGVVADGYLVGANVFCDLNGNLTQDLGEPNGTTGPGGKYTLTGTGPDPDRCTVVAEVLPNLTVDEDNPSQFVQNGYLLTAPAARPEFISPLTTLVQQRVSKGEDMAAAEAAVRNSIGMDDSTSLFEDYIAGKRESVHRVAKAVAAAMGELHVIYKDSNLSDIKDRMASIVGKVESDLPKIVEAPDTYTVRQPFTAEDVSGKRFIYIDGTILNVTEYGTDGSFVSFSNDYDDTRYVTRNTGTWTVENGVLIRNDSYGRVELTLLNQNETSLSVLGQSENRLVAAIMLKVTPVANNLISGRTFYFTTADNTGTLAFYDDGTGIIVDLEGSDPISWFTDDGLLVVDQQKVLYIIADGNTNVLKGLLVNYEKDEIKEITLTSVPSLLVGRTGSVQYLVGSVTYEYISPDAVVMTHKGIKYAGTWDYSGNTLQMTFPLLNSYPSVFRVNQIAPDAITFTYRHNDSTEWEGPLTMMLN